MRQPVFLGIDGGGSKARAILECGGRVLGRIEWNGLNPRDIGGAEFEARLESLLSPLLRSGSGPAAPSGPIYACAALAGAGDPAVRRRCRIAISRVLKEHGDCRRLRVVTDAAALAETHLGRGDGIILIAGTGSICLGVKRVRGRRRVVRAGGLGGTLDRGCGFRIGTRLVEHALGVLDGRERTSTCIDLLCRTTGMPLARAVRAFASLERSRTASLAGVVLRAYGAGDGFARSVIEEAVEDLVEMVASVKATAGLGDQTGLWLAGGLFENEAFRRLFRRRLTPALRHAAPPAAIGSLPAVLELARGLARSAAPARARRSTRPPDLP
jgi:N-acetylglucosamine kinase-like BadF-type ATPase